MYDVAVVGGGVIGGLVLRELARYDIKAVMLEKEADVASGSSKSNTGIVHAGFDAKEGSLKARFNVLGAKMMQKVCAELGVKYKNNGSLVVAYSEEEISEIQKLYDRGVNNGVPDMEILDQASLRKLEPNIADNAVGALYAKSAGIVCPYGLTVASIGNAMDNGASLICEFEVSSIIKDGENFILTSTNGKTVSAKVVINCAGMYSDKVASLIGDNSFKVNARKGEYILLDKSNFNLERTIFSCPTKAGKGIVVTKTVDGNTLLGPTSVEIPDKADKTTSAEGLNEVSVKASAMVKNIPFGNTISSFAGLRAYADRHDFVIEKSAVDNNFINVAGIESPGLTASPAIAKFVVGELVSSLIALKEKADFNPIRKAEYFFKNLSIQEKNEIIKKDPSYGKIICRCEQITLGEILTAIRENPKAKTVDAVKKRTRAGMGRCQGGFCQPTIAKIIADELGIDITEVTKSGFDSYLLTGVTK